MVPGVGTYDILPTNTRKANISVIPFRSKVFRFQVYGGDDAPGPGTYSPCENPVRRRTRSHMIGFFRQEGPINGDTPGPGSYISHEYKKKRLHPGGIRFEAYSGRGPLQSNEYPGPGQYEYRDTDNSIYSRKPTISFASKTERSHNGDNGNPGPGAYDLPSVFLSKEHHEAANPEPLLAFCTKAARYLSSEKESYPGPGAYTGEIAPRRPQLCNEKKSVRSFAVTLGHTKPPARSNLGPGTYDPEKPRKGPKYQLGSVAFCSAADRFPPLKFKEEKTDFIPRRDTERAPRRVHPARVLSDVILI
uniref:Uncharacterized protein TCIL3000_9_4590 n=1 Tax=Trypanosoma congolense (strain IL3000) TaxID=1068625 RepID=G0UUJ5_TRYCI|nr:unnamed protein product [Trypanosoma congolense IL3000]